MNKTYDIDRSVSDISFGAMTERLLSSSSQSFPVKKEIPAGVLKQLIDKSYEKRKAAGYDLHKCLTGFVEKGNNFMVRNAVEMFKVDYIEASLEVLKKAGLMAYSAISSTLMLHEEYYCLIPSLIFPVVTCFRDNDTKIRYSAVEAMYNICKICRVKVLESFDGIFRPMTELFADSDNNVKKAVEKLDLLLKTLVVECEASSKIFNSGKFMGIIREMLLSSANPNVQKLLVSWIIVLDSIPNFNMIGYLPNYLEGLFLLLSSKQENVMKTSFSFIKDLLGEVRGNLYGDLDLLFVMETMAKLSANPSELVRSVAIEWTSELVEKSDKVLFKIFPVVLKAALQCLADSFKPISEKAVKVNEKLIKFFKTTSRETRIVHFEEIVEVLMQYMNHDSIVTREAVLTWIITLHSIYPESLEPKLEILLNILPSRILDPEDSIVNIVLQVLCKIAEYSGYFDKVMFALLKLFSESFSILTTKGGVIITFLCKELGTENVYKRLAVILLLNNNFEFTQKMIALLNDLILTDPALEGLREKLKYCIEKKDHDCIEFFEVLFQTWCFNPISALSLTFLVQAYRLTYEILHIM